MNFNKALAKKQAKAKKTGPSTASDAEKQKIKAEEAKEAVASTQKDIDTEKASIEEERAKVDAITDKQE